MPRDDTRLNLLQLNLFVKDFPAMLRFYREVLGLELNEVDPGPPSDPLVNWASLRTGSVIVELFDAAVFWDTRLLGAANRDAVQLCFIIDDVDGTRARLEDAGVSCDPIVREGWGRYASFRDPEGNWLQIFEMFD